MPVRHPSPKRQRNTLKPSTAFDVNTFLTTAGIGRTVTHYRSKQVIFSQGERADTVLYIKQGRVKLSTVSKQGKEATIALLGPGDFLGEGCIASDQRLRLASASAISDCSILKIQKREILRVLHEEHGFSDLFVA